MRLFVKRLCLAHAAAALAAVAISGVVILREASGPDGVIAQDPYWGVVKWYVLDAHALLGVTGSSAALVWAAIRLYERRRRPEEPRQKLWKRLAPYAVGLVLVYGGVKYVRVAHPVFVHSVRVTDFPADERPDQVILTPGGDPGEGMYVQWRTATSVEDGWARYRQMTYGASRQWRKSEAASVPLRDRYLANDPTVMIHTARLDDLAPDTRYEYQVGAGELWSEVYAFETAPADDGGYSFMYLGDAQTGLVEWADLLRGAYARHSGLDFILVAGDLVNDGGHREEWDLFLEAGHGIFSECPIVPAIGNHDDDDRGRPWMYLRYFQLPDNGPEELTGRAYAFSWGPSRFVVLDSNLPAGTQTRWLEEQLAAADAPWLFTVLHHPVYASKPSRDNRAIRTTWAPLFDEYGVDVAFQGHDHAYMRTYPVREGQRVEEEGTIYLVTVSGDKYYEQDAPGFAAKAETDTSTYQIVDVEAGRVRYRAFTADGELFDAFTLNKPRRVETPSRAETSALSR